MKIANYEFWCSRTRSIVPLSLRFWLYRNWMNGIVIGVRLFGYKWEFGWYKNEERPR